MSNNGGDLDGTIEELVELEAELGGKAATESSRSVQKPARKTYDEGVIAGATKIPRREMPEEYPAPLDTEYVLRIDVEVEDGNTVSTYQEWPEGERYDGHIEKILDALGRDADEFADIYGDRVALETREGWHGIDLERTETLRPSRPQTAVTDDSLDLTRNLLAGALAVGGVGFALVDTLLDGLGMSLTLAAWFAIPALIYFDGKRIEDVSEWTPNTGNWILGTLLPGLNVPVGAAYLLDRTVRLSGMRSEEASSVWHKGVIASLLTLPLALVLSPLADSIAATLFGFGWMFMPLAVYFDAEYVSETTDWEPSKGLWAAAAIFFWIFGTGAYLLRRKQVSD